jgi:hypothetical protein
MCRLRLGVVAEVVVASRQSAPLRTDGVGSGRSAAVAAIAIVTKPLCGKLALRAHPGCLRTAGLYATNPSAGSASTERNIARVQGDLAHHIGADLRDLGLA